MGPEGGNTQVGAIPEQPKTRLRRAPMLPVAIAMMAGIVIGRYVPLPMGVFVVAGAVALVLAAATVRRAHLHILTAGAVAAGVLFLSAIYSQTSYYTVEDDNVFTYAAGAPILATIRGQIVTSPLRVEDEPGTFVPYRRPARTCFVLQCEKIKRGSVASGMGVSPMSPTAVPAVPGDLAFPAAQGQDAPGTHGQDANATAAAEWLPCTGQAKVTIREEAAGLSAGQEVELIGLLGRVPPPDNPGQTDWSLQGRLDGVMVYFSVPAADGAIVLSRPGESWPAQAFWNVRSALRQHLAGCGEVEDGRLLNALLTGERHPALKTLNRAMVRSGTAHFLSISGQHLVVFLGFMYLLCRLGRLSPRRSAMLVLAMLGLYLLLTEPNAPLFRSAIMAACVCLAVILGRQHSALNAVSAAGVIVLAVDPMQLFSAGFQLSYGIVAGMIVLHAPIRDLLFGRWLRRRGLVVFRDDQAMRRWIAMSAGNWTILLVTASLSASIVSVPLVAYHFGLFSPYAPVSSLALSPLVTAVLVPGYMSMALAWPMPHLSAALGSISAEAADLLTKLVMAMDHLPSLCLSLQPVGVVWPILFFAGVAMALLVKTMPFRRTALVLVSAAWLGLTVWTQLPAPAPDCAQLNILAVGDGQCVVLRTPGGKTFLFDAGTRSAVDLPVQVLMPFLRHERLPLPGEAWISHADSDHWNAIPAVLHACGLRKCFISWDFEPSPPEAADGDGPVDTPFKPAVTLLGDLLAGHVQVVHVAQGQCVQLDERTRVEVLWPPTGQKLSSNDSSLALKITCDDRSALLTGDLEVIGQKGLAAMPSARADVLILPHHGSYRPSLPELVQRVGASIVIASGNRPLRAPSGQAQAAEFLAHLSTGRSVLTTSRNGFIRVTLGKGRLSVESMR
jgi:competence protein ComEC